MIRSGGEVDLCRRRGCGIVISRTDIPSAEGPNAIDGHRFSACIFEQSVKVPIWQQQTIFAVEWRLITIGDIAVVLDSQHRTPGNLRAFVQATLRSIRTGRSSDVRFSSTEKIEVVPMMTKKMDFSYKDGEDYVFF